MIMDIFLLAGVIFSLLFRPKSLCIIGC